MRREKQFDRQQKLVLYTHELLGGEIRQSLVTYIEVDIML